jgi:RNA-directed DNA polymerase
MNAWCRGHRHAKLVWQHQKLVQKLRGHYRYYGIVGNTRSLRLFQYEVERLWRKWLSRRSQKGRINWERFNRLGLNLEFVLRGAAWGKGIVFFRL